MANDESAVSELMRRAAEPDDEKAGHAAEEAGEAEEGDQEESKDERQDDDNPD